MARQRQTRRPGPMSQHEQFMHAALDQARRALASGEVPIGAVVVIDGRVVAQRLQPADLRRRSDRACGDDRAAGGGTPVGNYRLTDATLYVTVEPCLMCVGALVHARVREVVYGAAGAEERRARVGGARPRAAGPESPLRGDRRRARGGVPSAHPAIFPGATAGRSGRDAVGAWRPAGIIERSAIRSVRDVRRCPA